MREPSEGSYCQHRLHREWGFGQVKTIAIDVVVVFFEHVGTRPIARGYVSPMLQFIPGERIPSATLAVLDRGEQKPVSRLATLTDANRACQACGQFLRRVVYADKRNWKSCPACSARNGSFHMLYAYPDSFASVEAQADGQVPQPGHRDCAECRQVRNRGVEPRFCGTI